MSKAIIVIFIEGETEIAFYKKVIKYIEEKNSLKREHYKIITKNMKGIGNYQRKALGIYKRNILPKSTKEDIFIFLTHDTDVFEHNKKPPISWKLIESSFQSEKSVNNVYRIKAIKSIEDWFLSDMEGIKKFLKLKNIKLKRGSKNGAQYISDLFKLGNKIYLKGSKMDDFINILNIIPIYNGIIKEVKSLEDILIKCGK